MRLFPLREIEHSLKTVASRRVKSLVDEAVLIVAEINDLPHAWRDAAAYIRDGFRGRYRNNVLEQWENLKLLLHISLKWCTDYSIFYILCRGAQSFINTPNNLKYFLNHFIC